MDIPADSTLHPGPPLIPISADEVMFSFLKSSADDLPPEIRRRLDAIGDNSTYEEKLVCREICRSIGKLDYFNARHWYRASLSPRQLEFVRLGQESSNNFSKFFSEGTYKPCIAADNIRCWVGLSEKRERHRDKVVQFSRFIDRESLRDVILCASNFTLNRRLKVFDGNHRIIAYALRHDRLSPFSCIVGFSKPLYFSLLQRALLAFPYFTETRDAVGFWARKNTRRVRSLLSGGMNYQPLLKDGQEMTRLSSSNADQFDESTRMNRVSERLCTDRARILRDDMRSVVGDLEGSTLLDIGCNVGFFCHFFASLGMRATGIENSQHNRHQRFSMSNSVQTARKMNRRYGLDCKFIDADARQWIRHQSNSFDVVFLLSVLHHFFIGYPVGGYAYDPMEEAKRFIEDIARITGKVLYIEYEDGDSSVSIDELMTLLRSLKLFGSADIVDYSDDFNRPIIRCLKS